MTHYFKQYDSLFSSTSFYYYYYNDRFKEASNIIDYMEDILLTFYDDINFRSLYGETHYFDLDKINFIERYF